MISHQDDCFLSDLKSFVAIKDRCCVNPEFDPCAAFGFVFVRSCFGVIWVACSGLSD